MSKQFIRVLIGEGTTSVRRVFGMVVADVDDILAIAEAEEQDEVVEIIAIDSGARACVLNDAEREALLGTIKRVASALPTGGQPVSFAGPGTWDPQSLGGLWWGTAEQTGDCCSQS